MTFDLLVRLATFTDQLSPNQPIMFHHQKMKGSPPAKKTRIYFMFVSLRLFCYLITNDDLMRDKQTERHVE